MTTDKVLVQRMRNHESLNLRELLTCSPFDPRLDLTNSLSSVDFWEHLFILPSNYENLYNSIQKEFTSKSKPITVKILHGYAGTGKTTFIHKFQAQCVNINNIYINFDDPLVRKESKQVDPETRAEINRLLREEELSFRHRARLMRLLITAEPPIACVLREHIRSSTDLWKAFKTLAGRLRQYITRYRSSFTVDCVELISVMPGRVEEEDAKIFIDSIPPRDVLLLFLVSVIEATLENVPVYIYFDNLDRVEVEYLSSKFNSDFSLAMERVSLICRSETFFGKKFDFTYYYKFIFCMRDANFSASDMQLQADYRHLVNSRRFLHGDDTSLYYRIVNKRLDIASEVFRDDAEVQTDIANARRMLSIYMPDTHEIYEGQMRPKSREGKIEGKAERLTPKEMRYFETAIAPLFNYDLKKLMPIVIELVKYDGTRDNLTEIAASADHERQFARAAAYGRGANLVHVISRYLRKDDFAKDIFDDQRHEVVHSEKGHCLKSRMLLAVILNMCRFDHKRHVVAPHGACPLLSLIDTMAGIYSPYDVLTKLEEMFLCHSKDWVNLISLEGKRIVGKGAFRSELDLMPSPMANDFALSDQGTRRAQIGDRARDALRNIHVRIAPAGFVFLKYIIVHFEFYSNFTHNRMSLFSSGMTREDDGKYRSVKIIDNVYALVREHVHNMSTFYATVIRKGVGLDPGAYKRSDFCFKFLGRGGASKRTEGHFHAFRLLNSIIMHIDQFRCFLLTSDAERDERVKFNKVLAGKILRFAKLLKYCEDPAAVEFFNFYGDQYQTLKDRGFSEFRTSIFMRKRG